MKCDLCKKNEAVLFVRQVSRLNTVELHLCAECAKQRGFSNDERTGDVTLSGLFSGLINGTNTKACQTCGRTLQEVTKYKKCGCPECYNTFKDEIISLMKKEGIYGEYTGSMPNKILHFKSDLTDRMMMQKLLEKAIADEDYEKAAVYRDRLKVLEKPGIDLADPDILGEGGASE